MSHSCANCGAEISGNANFCSHCGSQLNFEDNQSSIDSERICAECGGKFPITNTICNHCGCPIEDNSENNIQEEIHMTNHKASKKNNKKYYIGFSIIAFLIIAIWIASGLTANNSESSISNSESSSSTNEIEEKNREVNNAAYVEEVEIESIIQTNMTDS